MKEVGLTPEAASKNPGKVYGFAFLWTLVMSYNLGFFLNEPEIGTQLAVLYGFATGFGWIAAGVFVIGLFERRSTKLLAINGGYMTVALTMMAAVIGMWR